MLYRILTEDINRDMVVGLVAAHFGGFTVYPALGYWQGKAEKSLVVEIASDYDITDNLELVAKQICQANNQQTVLIQSIPCLGQFISSEVKCA